MREIWIDTEPFPPSPSVLAAAQAAGCAEIMSQGDQALVALGVPSVAVGHVSIEEPADFAPLPTLGQRQGAVSDQVDAMTQAIFAGGYLVPTGTLSGQTLQIRNNTDRTNWLTSQASYSAAVADGQGASDGAIFRTASNQTFTLTFDEALSVLLAMAAWGASIYANAWSLKDQVIASADPEAIDLTTGWPG